MLFAKSRYGHYYSCTKCKSSCKADKYGNQIGLPSNIGLRRARNQAHEVFDVIWKSEKMSRTEAYEWMSIAMDINPINAHISKFDVSQCLKLIFLVQKSFPDLFPLELEEI